MPTPKAGHYEEADYTDPKTLELFGLTREGRNIKADDVTVHVLDDEEFARAEAKEPKP